MSNLEKNLNQLIREKIVIIDGSMGVLIQKENLNADDFGGEKYEGCNDYLVISKPDIIKKIHCEYLTAGADIIETNTFGANRLTLKEYGLENETRRINKEASLIAKQCVKQYRDKFVAGSIGPTNKSLTLSDSTNFDEMRDSYYEQIMGLVEGGCDLLFIETGHDTLNVKSAIISMKEAFRETGITIPFFLSASILLNGTMLAGQDIETFYISTKYSNPFAYGLNCAVGPKDMKDHIQLLSSISSMPTFIYPNAGLPNDKGEYDETPETFVKTIEYYVDNGWLNLVGGCCGTNPEHIKAISEMTRGKKPRQLIKKKELFSVSGVEKLYQDENIKLIIVGERTNVQGSRKFKRLIKNQNYDEALIIAKEQINKGAHIIDICVEDTSIDEIETIKTFFPKLSKSVKAPLMIDSTNPLALETALKFTQGKAIINSINLEGGKEKLDRIIPIIKKYGASTIVGVIDEEGMSITLEKKLSTAKRLYKLLVEEYKISPQDLIFDMLVFTVNAGNNETYYGSAKATIEAVKEFKSLYPDVMTVLGVSNVSFGLPQNGRETLNSVFLQQCVYAGLDLAIINPAMIKRYNTIDKEEIKLCEELIYNNNDDNLMRFVNYFRNKTEETNTESKSENLSPDEFIKRSLLTGNKNKLNENLDKLLTDKTPMHIISNILMQSMAYVGKLFGEGKLIVNEVLESAEVMKSAIEYLEPMLNKDNKANKKKVLLATVKGDVHDIGKNLVEIILSSNGYDVIDLGTKIDSTELIKAIREHNPDFIGLSGLLVKSAKQMIITAEDLTNENISIPIIVGGAALTENFASNDIQKAYNGKVFYAKDAMTGLSIINELSNSSMNGVLK